MSMMKAFPYILYEILNDDSRSESPIMWLPHGRAFRILDKKKFATDVMPLYFKATKMSSFKRQLNLWGFKLIICFGDEVLWRESFVKDHPEYLKSIQRSPAASWADSVHHCYDRTEFYQMLHDINITFGGSANNDDNGNGPRILNSQHQLQIQNTTTNNNTSVQQTFWSTNNDNDNGAPIPNLANQMEMNSQQQLQNTTNNNASVQQTFFWPGARQASSSPPAPEFMRHQHQLFPVMNQPEAAVLPSLKEDETRPLTSPVLESERIRRGPIEADGVGVYDVDAEFEEELERRLGFPKSYARDNSSSSLSTYLSLHGVDADGETSLNTVSGHGFNFNDVAQEELKQASYWNEDEGSSPMDEFSQLIESSIHLLPP